jgi:ubiquinone/menaquinone biosynthesis C-methylase UbiE
MSENKQKDLWETLAKKNAKYYIVSDHGHSITEEKFQESARKDFERLIVNDPILDGLSGTILDIGCGIGRLDALLTVFFDHVIGVDISGEMIRQAKERLEGFPITFVETDGSTFPMNDATIDVAFSYLVFQHIKTEEMLQKNFQEVLRVLKPGGIFKVLLRSDIVDVDTWWGGVAADETYPTSIGFKLLKKEEVSNYGLWLWLKKP